MALSSFLSVAGPRYDHRPRPYSNISFDSLPNRDTNVFKVGCWKKQGGEGQIAGFAQMVSPV